MLNSSFTVNYRNVAAYAVLLITLANGQNYTFLKPSVLIGRRDGRTTVRTRGGAGYWAEPGTTPTQTLDLRGARVIGVLADGTTHRLDVPDLSTHAGRVEFVRRHPRAQNIILNSVYIVKDLRAASGCGLVTAVDALNVVRDEQGHATLAGRAVVPV